MIGYCIIYTSQLQGMEPTHIHIDPYRLTHIRPGLHIQLHKLEKEKLWHTQSTKQTNGIIFSPFTNLDSFGQKLVS